MLDKGIFEPYADRHRYAPRSAVKMEFLLMVQRLQNGTSHPVELSWWDKSQEVGRLEFQMAVVTATIVSAAVVNFTAQAGLFAAFITDVNAIVIGLPRLNRWVNQVVINANPAKSDINQLAVREIGLKVRYIDATTQAKFECTVPCLDLSKVVYLPIVGNDAVSLTEPAEIVTFIDSFEATAVAPYTGNAVVVRSLEVVGRHN